MPWTERGEARSVHKVLIDNFPVSEEAFGIEKNVACVNLLRLFQLSGSDFKVRYRPKCLQAVGDGAGLTQIT